MHQITNQKFFEWSMQMHTGILRQIWFTLHDDVSLTTDLLQWVIEMNTRVCLTEWVSRTTLKIFDVEITRIFRKKQRKMNLSHWLKCIFRKPVCNYLKCIRMLNSVIYKVALVCANIMLWTRKCFFGLLIKLCHKKML